MPNYIKLSFLSCIAILLLSPFSILYSQKKPKIEQTSSITKTTLSYKGKERKARIISVKSTFDHDLQTFFEEEMIIANTLKITKPLASIKMKTGKEHVQFQEGFTYDMRIYSLGFIPFGGIHYIYIETLDKENTFIQTRERNRVARVWDHRLIFEAVGEDKTAYEDEVTLYAGFLTPIFARYLVTFYKMRHRNWAKLMAKKYGR